MRWCHINIAAVFITLLLSFDYRQNLQMHLFQLLNLVDTHCYV